MSKVTQNPFRLSNPTARELCVEFDRLVDEIKLEGFSQEEAEAKAKSMQKEKYGTKNMK
jgi:hypothetical protein